MEFIRGLNNVKPQHNGCVLTIGKFDGVHKGHQAVLKNVIDKAAALSLPATVMVFEPQPEEFFVPTKAPARLSPLRDKYEQLKEQGVNRLLAVSFNADFASQSADEFVQHWLVQKLGVKFLVVGDDFRFGKNRAGDFAMLQAAGKQYGFEVVSTQSFRMHEHRISSTAVREALQDSDFKLAEEMLGRPFAIQGRVVHGEKKGRTIGFPTANVMLKRCRAPLHGVFAVRVDIDGTFYKGVANIGTRPTLNGVRNQLEVHIFDLKSDLYGKPIKVMPVAKIRDEQKFASFEALKIQIQRDADQARACF
ncbi:bifunctional riboflavin kinase/FAD synthetase [Alteromonas sp. KUL49]|uniref:bifunctional riboflavin kinase/FAD synthetase n=1 Tax=Alteromonas sp. KUL49 TaxID=2480798 RepID=UPI00102EE062|nr:bifunctional riboflavin kinase/FAD synthetase [Alteromonas sp. KUL49]TAP39841.1 bifunctional riboflavin kinase/FAD synthetase [Alteromonas sp. KUL49]GEA11851.1 riboflavin biosynthesis protein [Alteromonas sp. KUL49]